MPSSPGPVSSAGERGREGTSQLREELSEECETLEGLQAVKEVPTRVTHLEGNGVWPRSWGPQPEIQFSKLTWGSCEERVQERTPQRTAGILTSLVLSRECDSWKQFILGGNKQGSE